MALLELPRGLSATELAGFGTGPVSALSNEIEESFRRRLVALPAETQRLLLIAAADPLGEPAVVWRAAELEGIGAQAGAPAEEAGLCEFGARVQFRHPLVRAGAYAMGRADGRRRAHAAIAEVTDVEADPDRRAWHRALASAGPDDEVADELERSAVRAGARGGPAAAAAFLERAVDLTLDPACRAERALAPISRELDLHWLFFAGRMLAPYLWDADAWDALSGRILKLVRDACVLALLPMAVSQRVGWELFAGDLTAAAALVVDQHAVHEAIGGDRWSGSRIARSCASMRGFPSATYAQGCLALSTSRQPTLPASEIGGASVSADRRLLCRAGGRRSAGPTRRPGRSRSPSDRPNNARRPRRQIQTLLDELFGEADKLRRALAALGSRDGAASPASGTPSASPERARRAPAPRTATRKPARASARTATTAASAKRVEPPVSAPAGGPARTAARAASGSTKAAVLQALAGGSAMTAGEVASATGLGRASVSTTLSKLATSGEVTKAARGYQLAGPTAAELPADVGASGEDGELGV